MRNRPAVAVPLFIAFMGFAAFFNAVSSPRFETFRTIDVFRLVASGMCFGAALAALLIFFFSRRSG